MKLPPNAVVHDYQGGNESVATIAKAGVKVIVSSLTDMYIAGGPPWEQVYQDEIMPAGLSKEEQKNVLGGATAIWGETMDVSGSAPPALFRCSNSPMSVVMTTCDDLTCVVLSDGSGLLHRHVRVAGYLRRRRAPLERGAGDQPEGIRRRVRTDPDDSCHSRSLGEF